MYKYCFIWTWTIHVVLVHAHKCGFPQARKCIGDAMVGCLFRGYLINWNNVKSKGTWAGLAAQFDVGRAGFKLFPEYVLSKSTRSSCWCIGFPKIGTC